MSCSPGRACRWPGWRCSARSASPAAASATVCTAAASPGCPPSRRARPSSSTARSPGTAPRRPGPGATSRRPRPSSRPPAAPRRAPVTAGRIRVLWLTKGLGRGGAEQLLVNCARHADRERYEIEVAYVLPWKDALVPALEAAGVTVHCLGGAPGRLWPWRLARLLARRRYHLVHSHMPIPAAAARLLTLGGGSRCWCTPSTTSGSATGPPPGGPTR
ncbi:glycosyltransferase [Kitasatospora gansuensis]